METNQSRYDGNLAIKQHEFGNFGSKQPTFLSLHSPSSRWNLQAASKPKAFLSKLHGFDLPKRVFGVLGLQLG
jgi:hypothetical protein